MQQTSSIQPESQSLVPWDVPANSRYTDLMNDVVEPTKEINPYLTWMTGKLPTSDRQMPVGWHVHKGVNPQLDALLTRLHYKQHQIEHESEKGEVELVDYWAMNYRWDSPQGKYVIVPCSLFVIAQGVKDKREMKNPKDRNGVAYGWEVHKDRDGGVVYKANGEPKKTPRIKLRAYIHEVLPAEQTWDDANGFTEWFQVSISGYLVDDAFTVLYSQYRAMRAYNQRLAVLGRGDTRTPFWALSNPTVPAETPRRVVSKDGQSTPIVPMRSLIPVREQDITDDFLRQHRIPSALQQTLLEDEVLLDTWNWSIEESEYLEGVKPRPTGSQEISAILATGVFVEEEHPGVPAATLPADPTINDAQQTVLRMMCNADQNRVQTLCQKYQVPDLSHLRVSQFKELLIHLSEAQS